MNRLTTLWFRGAVAADLDRSISAVSSVTRTHRYRIDGSTDEDLLWIEARGREETGGPISNLSFMGGEIFTFDLAHDVGVTLASPTPWLYLVHTDIPADIIDDYNAWYDQEHLPRLVRVPGVERARRYVADPGLSPRYLTAYDLSIKDAFESPEGLKARKTPWTERMRSLFQNTRRKMCVLQR
jgi:hypothetical protein